MATVLEYHPRSLRLPVESPILREFDLRRFHDIGMAGVEASEGEGFDRRTLLYDVALDRTGRTLVGIAPPMMNLAAGLLPVTAEARRNEDANWSCISFRRRQRSRHEQWEMRLPRHWGAVDAVDFRLRFANATEFAESAVRFPLRTVFQQWSTLQKDNPQEWINDWLLYAAKQGAERVLLYDNGSADATGLVQRCACIEANLEVVLIPWAFPYGPPHMRQHRFAQRAQMNHANLVLGACSWQGFMDLDEYPVAPEGLTRFLTRQPKRRGLVQMDHYRVPAIEGEVKASGVPRAFHFGHRSHRLRGKGFKYFARPEGLREARTHNGRCFPGFFRWRESAERIYFLHYERLTTGWRDPDRGMTRLYDPRVYVQDDAVRAALRSLDQDES